MTRAHRRKPTSWVRRLAGMPESIWTPLACGGLVLLAGLLSYLLRQPWLFPSLGPTAFIQAHRPRSSVGRFDNASHSKKTYLSAQYRRLAGRRGKKRAIIAVGHTMLVMAYHMLRDEVDYKELGHDYLDKLQPQRLTAYLVKRLESLGHKVTLTHEDQAA